jgi:hypothetical protein
MLRLAVRRGAGETLRNVNPVLLKPLAAIAAAG